MKTITVNGHKLKIYESIEEIPITRFHKYNKYTLIDSGIGSNISDFNARIDRVVKYIKIEPKSAVKELENIRQAVDLINNEICPKHLAFIALIAEIDGQVLDDLSDENIIEVSHRLSVSVGWLTQLLASIKKKIELELSTYFPNPQSDMFIIQHFESLKRRTILVLDAIIDGMSRDDEIEEIDNEMLLSTPVNIFYGSENAEVLHDKKFEDMCLILSQHFGVDAKGMTVREFYSATKRLEDEIKQKQKQLKK